MPTAVDFVYRTPPRNGQQQQQRQQQQRPLAWTSSGRKSRHRSCSSNAQQNDDSQHQHGQEQLVKVIIPSSAPPHALLTTKASLSYFQARLEAWRLSPRKQQMQKLPPPLPPYIIPSPNTTPRSSSNNTTTRTPRSLSRLATKNRRNLTMTSSTSVGSNKTLPLASPCFTDGTDQLHTSSTALTTTTTSPEVRLSNLFSSFSNNQPVSSSSAAAAAAASSTANINNNNALSTAWTDKRETATATSTSTTSSSSFFGLSATTSRPLSSNTAASFGFPPIISTAITTLDNQQQQQQKQPAVGTVVTYTSPFNATEAAARYSLLSTTRNNGATTSAAFGFSFVSNAATGNDTATTDMQQESVVLNSSTRSPFDVVSLTSSTATTTTGTALVSSLSSPFASIAATTNTLSTASAELSAKPPPSDGDTSTTTTTLATTHDSAPSFTRIVQENNNNNDDDDVREDTPSPHTTMKTTTTTTGKLTAAAAARMVPNDECGAMDIAAAVADAGVTARLFSGTETTTTTGPPIKSLPSDQKEHHLLSVTPTTTMAIPNESSNRVEQKPPVHVVPDDEEPRSHGSLNVAAAVVAPEIQMEPVGGGGDKTTSDKSLFKAVIDDDENGSNSGIVSMGSSTTLFSDNTTIGQNKSTTTVAVTKLVEQQQQQQHNVIDNQDTGQDMTAKDKGNDATTMVLLAAPNTQAAAAAAAADVAHVNAPSPSSRDDDETLVAPKTMQANATTRSKEEENDATPTTTTAEQVKSPVSGNPTTSTTSTENSDAASLLLLGPNPCTSDSRVSTSSSFDTSGFVFGSGTKAPTFSFATPSSLSGGGFPVLTSSNNSVFGAPSSPAATFNIFGTCASSSSLTGISSMAKPLFGNVQAPALMTPLVEKTKQQEHDTILIEEPSQGTPVEKDKNNTSSSNDVASDGTVPDTPSPVFRHETPVVAQNNHAATTGGLDTVMAPVSESLSPTVEKSAPEDGTSTKLTTTEDKQDKATVQVDATTTTIPSPSDNAVEDAVLIPPPANTSGCIFGSGTKAPTFSFATSSLSGGGFPALTSSKNNSVFGAPSPAATFNIFGTCTSSSLSGISSMAKPLFGNVQAPLKATTTTAAQDKVESSNVNHEKNAQGVATMEEIVSPPDTAALKDKDSISICPATTGTWLTEKTSEVLVPVDKSDLTEPSPASCEQQPVVDNTPGPNVGCDNIPKSPHEASAEVATHALTEESMELSISDEDCQQPLAWSSKDGSVASTDESLPLEPVVVPETPPKSSTGATSTLAEPRFVSSSQRTKSTSKVVESTVSKPAFVFGTKPVFRFGIDSMNPPPSKVDFLPQKTKGPSFGHPRSSLTSSMAKGPIPGHHPFVTGAKFEFGVNRTDAKSPSPKKPFKFAANSSGSSIQFSAKGGSKYEFGGSNRTNAESPNLTAPIKLVANGARSSLNKEPEHEAETNTLLPPCLEYDPLGLRMAARSEHLVPKMAASTSEMFPGAVLLKNTKAPKSQSIFMPIMVTNREVYGLSYIERLAKDHLVVPLCSVLVRDDDCESSVHDLISQLLSAQPSNSTSSSLGACSQRLDPQREFDERSVMRSAQHEIQLL